MLQIFPKRVDDLLDRDSLPPSDKTELNYRTRPLSSDQEQRLTFLILLGPLPVVLPLAVMADGARSMFPWFDNLVIGIGILFLLWFGFRQITGLDMRRDLIAAAFYSIAVTSSVIWSWMGRSDVWAWRVGLIVAWLASCLIARQAAAWILVGPTVDHETMKRWKFNLPQILPHGLSLECPELLTYYVGLMVIGPTWLLSAWAASHFLGGMWYWPLCFLVTAPLVWMAWHIIAFAVVPWPSFRRSWAMTWHALVTFVTYDIYYPPAAGVFRFPTCWLRPPWARWIFLGLVLVVIAFSYATCCPDPLEASHQGGSFLGQLVVNYVLIIVSGPIVLCGVLWMTAGTLLDRFDRELSHHQDPNTTDWDNYIDRLVNSGDDLEREHLLGGTSETGDYPILIHREIHDMHVHLTGDTGASKTSLGIAPQATQLIARGDATVVIIDLKGDKALFETCRREAARSRKLRFRWLSNEVGKTSFAFNPFLQSHNRVLTTEQLTQELLQGLSLDYGLEYGAGYFTAMNEIVLSNVLKNTGTLSFRDLSKHMANRSWYETIGHKEDWAQARHLGALVSRLAASDALNVVPGMYPNQPQVQHEAIDVTNLFDEPQVVYLSLSSAVEPTNAPAIARLFLWAAFTAASHQPQNGNRVYFFIDEVQQIISDGMKLIFEQFRGLGGTIIAAHQTAGQLRRQGTDLGDTIDSCTAVKQVFRASDLRSIDQLQKLSGMRKEQTAQWFQSYERGVGELVDRYDPVLAADGLVRVTERDEVRLDTDDLLALGSRRQSSLIRFTFGSGYTQFAGASVPMISQYSISPDEYERRQTLPWPTSAGAFTIGAPAKASDGQTSLSNGIGKGTGHDESGDAFVANFDRRGQDRREIP